MTKFILGRAEREILKYLYNNYQENIFNNKHKDIREDYNLNRDNKVKSLLRSLNRLRKKGLIQRDDLNNYRITVFGECVVEKLRIAANSTFLEDNAVNQK